MKHVYSEKDIGRFLSKMEKMPNGCWDWVGYIHPKKGRGMFSSKSRIIMAYRFAYEVYVGEVPDGLEIDHLCHNRKCVNPAHLEAVTGAENQRRHLAYIKENGEIIQCKKCGNDMRRVNHWSKYCGSWRDKTGCAYIASLETFRRHVAKKAKQNTL